ncbi:MAG TPA: histidinol-phosphate transaminase, partial [Stellaceae bacterium]|nr:histidinol-phosphate transaminase [Stellaceae bacterium]
MSAAPTPRPGILDIAAYQGGEGRIPGIAKPIRLASNESALGPSPAAVAAYEAAAGDMFRYPDGHATAMRDALARHHGIDAARIVCGAGSDDLIHLL